MNSETYYQRYESLYFSLRDIIKSSERRVIDDVADEIFRENVNFFVKSYLISICTYLEAYLQDGAFKYANELDARVKRLEIPHNFIHWRVVKGIKDKELDFKNIDLSVNKKEISENISSNPYRTIKLFKYLGIDLTSKEKFESNKDLVNSVVTTRIQVISA